MHRRHAHVLLLLFGLLAGSALLAPGKGKDFPWGDFKARSLQAVVALDLHAVARLAPKEAAVVLTGKELVLSKMTVIFSGLVRPLSRERRQLLDRWAIQRDYAPEYVERYENEYLFFEGEHKYWIAVQKSVAPQLVQQIKEGKEVELYLLSGVGALRVEGRWNWLLLLQEFQLPP
ncbi:MAG: hypothetical protein ACHQ5A_04145 [Opitutales bacterium]